MRSARWRPLGWLRCAVLAVGIAIPSAAGAQPTADPLAEGRAALAHSDYARAEKALAAAVKSPKDRGAALLVRARLELVTGRYADAEQSGRQAAATSPALRVAAAPWIAEALVRQGKLDLAIKVLEPVKSVPTAYRARVALGELTIRRGRRKDATAGLHSLLDAYKTDAIKPDDAEGVALAGRAAQLLRQPKNANNLYEQAGRIGGDGRGEIALWEVALFLDKYNPGEAGRSAKIALTLAPHDPRAHVAMAHVILELAMDFDAADREIAAALAVDPHLAEAYVVRAGLALRDLDIDAADRAVAAGLRDDPENLELLSMKAATRFLADDLPGYEAVKARVLELNPEYSSFYQVVGEYAEWEHRYDDIVKMMREAVAVDPLDDKARATLGLNLIRAGDEKAGVKELDAAFKTDGFNARVLNTLNLFETTIAKEYDTVEGPIFRVRYARSERKVLERYVPPLLQEAWASMVARYHFTPTTPVGIELYADSEHFSVRTSGLPNVGIQGVCFGKTLAALSPSGGEFNWGEILWHELAHVFAIQLSRNHVPRWFTEGLSEYETIVRRPEWRREEEPSLYRALRAGKIPKVADFNRAFTHVDDVADVTMAYFAASQIVVFIVERWGFEKVPAMLRLWGDGKRTPEVVKQALGVTADELDQAFHAWLEPRLARFATQVLPGDPQLVPLRQAMEARNLDRSAALADALIAGGHDGYVVRMHAADIAEARKDVAAMRKHLDAAHQLDPSQPEPLQALYDLAHQAGDAEGELAALRQLWKIDQHDRKAYAVLLDRLVARGLWDEAVSVGQSAMMVDVENPEVHRLYARALARTGKHVSAISELNSAILAQPDPELAARIYRSMAEGYRKLGQRAYAESAEGYAKAVAARPAPPRE